MTYIAILEYCVFTDIGTHFENGVEEYGIRPI
jgi:hypothetical protein